MTVSSKTLRFALAGAVATALFASGGFAASSISPAKSVQQTQAALAKGNAEKAIVIAERAVAEMPREASLRTVLAQAYLKAGRFESAATTFEDAIELGDASPRSVLGLALAHAASGRNQDAVAVLDEHRQGIPAEDLGLALALAGETGRGVAVLTDGLRASEGSAKLRQNLAYAYALDGRWQEARLMVSQDLPADQVDARITEWAMQGKPDDYQKRVAALLGTPVVKDLGQPQYLALGDVPTAAPVQTAVAEPAQLPAPAPAIALADAPAPVAQAVDQPAANGFDSAFAQPSFVSQPVVQSAPVLTTYAPPKAAMPRAKALRPIAARPAANLGANGTHRVQLGAFSSAEGASRAVTTFAARNPSLRGRLAVTQAVVNGKIFWRVAAAGFDAGSARSTCSTLKARGGACFAYAASRGSGSLALARR